MLSNTFSSIQNLKIYVSEEGESMENKLLELLEQKGRLSMNDDIFPILEEEFNGQFICEELYELAHQYILQLLYGVYAAGVEVIAVPKFSGGQQFGQMVVSDVIYEKVTL